MERTTISKTGLRAGAVLLASLALAGCSKDPAGATVDPGREAVILSIAEANYGVSGGGSKSAESAQGGARAGAASGGGTPQTRAIVDGGGSTFFTDRDRLGLFLRGDGYEDVDNRIVQLDYPGEGPKKRWNITGEAIPLYTDAATVTAYFPYSDAEGLTMSAVPLNPGPYDVNSNDVVWQRDTVHSTHTQAMFLEMQHAMTRVKIRLSRGNEVGDMVDGGVVYWVNPDDATDFRVVALDQSPSKLALDIHDSYLGPEMLDKTARNGADVWQLAKQSSDNKAYGASGIFATDFPAFSYCYNYKKTDGVPEGTWFLPSRQELEDLYRVRGSVGPVITANGGANFPGGNHWSASQYDGNRLYACAPHFGNGNMQYFLRKRSTNWVRCVREPLASESGVVYTGEGKVTGVRIADAGDVAADDRVVFLDGTLDLTQATPVVTPGWPDAVADMSEKTLTAEGVLYDLLLLPVDKIDEGKVMLEVELDGKVLSVPFPVDAVDKWEAGKAYTYEVEVRNGGAQVVFGKATATPWNYGGSLSGDLDTSKPEYGGGDVQDWGDNEWQTGGPVAVGDLYGGGVVYWVNPDDATDFRVVSLNNGNMIWAGGNYNLGSEAQNRTARNGAAIMILAKNYSDNNATGNFATDFPAFNYCYDRTDGNVTKGTWFLPSKQELSDLYIVKNSIDSVIAANGGQRFRGNYHWSASYYDTDSSWCLSFSNGNNNMVGQKSYEYYVRCVRKGGDGPVTGEVTDASLVPSPADNVIPAEGGEYSVRLTGNWTGSVPVRMSVGGNTGGLWHAVCSDGAATCTFTVPANASYSPRTVTFEYLWNGAWSEIGTPTQSGGKVDKASVAPAGDIPGQGGKYSVTLTGVLPAGGVEVRANIPGAAPVTGTVIASGTPVELSIPANRTTGERMITFEYEGKEGAWVQFEQRTQILTPESVMYFYYEIIDASELESKCASHGQKMLSRYPDNSSQDVNKFYVNEPSSKGYYYAFWDGESVNAITKMSSGRVMWSQQGSLSGYVCVNK